ncbi:hypothetical protein CA85_38660 [Allorhodopirellula solitaria]|uniref:Uncharacterized protein n=1 Tax=Allorhodopirellula solitaria TaxID=2527987 RepID=A0A5C5X8B8_9BACT|nr:hypothetical protein CA85_38660 [Allorhodopirellula solitaria]
MGRRVGGRLKLQEDAVLGNWIGNFHVHQLVELTDGTRPTQG